MVDVIDYYDEAEEYLEHISDDIPLFTNTRDGVFSEGARTAPAPLEANSDLFVSPMRAQLARRQAQKVSMRASGGVASAAARFEGRGGGPLAPRASGSNVGRPLGSSQMQEAAAQEQPIEIPDLQDGIADLQMGDSDEEEEDVDTAEDFGDIPVAPSRSSETSPQLQPKSHGSPPSDKSPGLPDKMMSELAFANAEGRDVSPHVIQGLVQIMRDGAHEKRKKATIAMCNLCCESQQNRAYAGDAGAVPVLVLMMHESQPDQHLQRLATACICNLSADAPLKDAIATAGAIPHLSRLLESNEDSADARAATAHAAATLWSLCVDMDHIKPLVAQEHTLKALMLQLRSPESFVRGQACGCVGEVCIGNKHIKGLLSSLNVIPYLIDLLAEEDPATQRLAASALCNLCANHDENKKMAREAGLVDALIKLLKSSTDDAVQSAAAGGLYNLVTSQDRQHLEREGVVEVMRRVPISRNINVRLGIKDKK